MNYAKIYESLIERSRTENRKYTIFSGYEKHHIIPKSLGGSNKNDNLAILTPREHCIAHMLLVKMYTGESKAKMCYALISMMRLRNKHRESITSKQYESLRKMHQKLLQDPDYRAMRSAKAKLQWTPEKKLALSEKTKNQWKNTNLRETFASDEFKKKAAENMQSRWQDPNYAKARSESTKEQWQNSDKKPNKNKI
jgi:hypothetical protein